MSDISLAPGMIIEHYAKRKLAMNTMGDPRLGIKTVYFRDDPKPIVTVTLTNGTKERWVFENRTWILKEVV